MSGHEQRPEDDDHDEQRESDDEREVERQGVGQLLADVDVPGRLAGHAERDAAVERRRRAKARHELLGGDARRSFGRDDLERGDRAVVGGADRGDRDDIVEAGERRGDLHLVVEGLVLGRGPGEVGDDEQRAVRAVAELVGDDVVGVVLGRPAPSLCRPGGRGAWTPRGPRGRRGRRRQRATRATAVAGRHRPGGRGRRRAGPVGEPGGLATAEDALADEAEQRRGEGHRDEHGDRDAGRADGAHQAEERDAGHVEREERDDDGRAGEDDRVAGGAGREAMDSPTA